MKNRKRFIGFATAMMLALIYGIGALLSYAAARGHIFP